MREPTSTLTKRTATSAAAALAKLALFARITLVAAASTRNARGDEDAQVTVSAAQAAAGVTRATQTKLANGLTVVIDRDASAPVISLSLRYATGSRDDPPDHPGLSLLIQRMMVTRTLHVPEAGYYQTLDRIGASPFSQGTGADYTELWATIPTNALAMVLWLWSDQMAFFLPGADQALLDAQRDVVKSERRQTVENAPYGSVRELARQALYPEGHPYHGTTLGDSLDGITLREVKAQFDAHYAPSNAVLVLSGDVDPDAALLLIQRYFGGIPAGRATVPHAAQVSLKSEVRLDVRASVREAAVVMTWPVPGELAEGDADLDVVAHQLGGRRVAFLHWTLVDQMKIATTLSARINERALGSDFEIWINVAAGHTPDEAITAADQVIESFKNGSLEMNRFWHASEEAWLPRVFALEKTGTRASRFGAYFFALNDANGIGQDFGRYDTVTAESSRAAAKKWLHPKNRVVTIVTPDPAAPPSGQLRERAVLERHPVVIPTKP